MRLAIALAALLALASSCATVGQTVADACPESRALRCATPPTCSVDRDRGCRVCACEAWNADPSSRSEAAGRTYQPAGDPAAGPTDLRPPAQ